CGLAAHALFPAIPVAGWGVIHALAAFAFVWFEGYGVFERAMKWAIGLMFVTIVGSALLQPPPVGEALRGLAITVPPGSTVLLLGVVGGVGGTLTLLSYNYWMQEKGWRGAGWIRAVRADLGVGYALTGVFGVALTLLAATVLHPQGIRIEGSQGVLALAQVLGQRFGGLGEKVFLVGFWGAVATSVLGVWQGVPYLFADFVDKLRSGENVGVATRGKIYRGYLAFLTFPPMLILALGKPVWVVVVYAAVGSLFMPVLAATLLVLNNRRSHGTLRNGWATNLALVLCLALFAFLAWQELRAKLG
ncbi:MAG: Nramp family divalent metal transporter, partial [Gemmatimonadetes bacterium]|nr:Nramp family divalent metal transporter [Gemmatimonadota bacterium]